MILIVEIFPLPYTVQYMYEFLCDLITERGRSAKHQLINCVHVAIQSHFFLYLRRLREETIFSSNLATRNVGVYQFNYSLRSIELYTRKNAQVVTSLQTSCYKSAHKLSTSCACTACSQFVVTSLKQAVNNL